MREKAIFTVRKAFSNNAYISIPSTPSIRTSYSPSIIPTLVFTTISGPLPGGKQLVHPLVVQIQNNDEEVLISELNFYIHASGHTISEALAEFKRVLSEELDELIRDESHLGSRLQKQLQYLRSIIKME